MLARLPAASAVPTAAAHRPEAGLDMSRDPTKYQGPENCADMCASQWWANAPRKNRKNKTTNKKKQREVQRVQADCPKNEWNLKCFWHFHGRVEWKVLFGRVGFMNVGPFFWGVYMAHWKQEGLKLAGWCYTS